MKSKLIASLLWLLALAPGGPILAAPQDNWHNYTNLNLTLPAAPRGIAVAPNGKVYVGVTTSPQKIQIYNQDTTFVSEFGSGSLTTIAGIACDASSNVYVYDAGTKQVKVFDANGNFLRQWGGTGTGNGLFATNTNGGNRIAVDSSGNVYVADTSNFIIQKFSSVGTFLLQWGGSGTIAGQFGTGPMAVTVASKDLVIVSSPSWTQSFDTGGNYIARVAGGSTLNLTALPDGLVVTGPNTTVASFFNYDGLAATGSLTYSLAVALTGPNGLATDGRGRLYVADSSATNKRVVVFERAYQVENPPVYNAVPQPLLLGSAQRAGSAIVDIDYKIVDPDSATVQTGVLGFLNGADDLANIVKLSTFVEGTGANIGLARPANTTLRLSWNASADFGSNFGNIQFEILANDGRALQPFHWITLPANGPNPAIQVSDRPVPDSDLLSVWYWLIATNDPAIRLAAGQIFGVGGSYDGQLLADTTTTTPIGRTFLYQRLNVHAITGAEGGRASAGRYGFKSVDFRYSVVNGFTSPNTHLYAWGNNASGQTTLGPDSSGVTAIAVGNDFSLRLSGGVVSGWGNSSQGQITIPAGLSGVTAIAGGGSHGLALLSNGTVAAWGYNSNGQVTGTANTVSPNISVANPVTLNGTVLTGVVAIAAGDSHSLALLSNGTVVAWGNNQNGQVTGTASGVSPYSNVANPVILNGNVLTGVTAIAGGGQHSLALKSDGTVVGWGYNGLGQTTIPTGLTGVTAIAAGYYHSLALKSDGTVVGWGYNTYGQTTIPTGLTGVIAIAAGQYHSLARKSDGTVVAWGDNYYGQITGTPTPTSRNAVANPVTLNGSILTGIDVLAPGPMANHTLVLDLP